MKQNIQALGHIIGQLNYLLDRKQKKESIWVFVCMIFESGLELLGVSAIYPFLQMMLNPAGMKGKWYVKWLYFLNPEISTRMALLSLGIVIILIYVVKNVCMIIFAYVRSAFSTKFQRDLSVKMLSSYLKHPYQFFLDTNSGEIMRGIHNDVAGAYQTLVNFFTLIAECLTVIVLGIFLFMSDALMTVAAMTLAFMCLLLTILGFKNRMKKAGQRAREAASLKYQYGYQSVNGIKEIMVLDRKNNFVEQYRDAASLEQKALVINDVINACPDRILEGVCIGGIIGIVCIRIAGGIELNSFIPVLGMFAMAAFKILPCISKISIRINAIVYAQGYLQGAYQNLKEANEYEEELKKYVLPETGNSVENVEEIRFSSELKIDHVAWKYTNTRENVLDNIELTVKKGESIALIGASGAGKTTLADIIMGLLKPQAGTIFMDGVDIFTIPHQWAKIIGYVPQSVFLIDDTVRRNVAFGLKEKQINDDKVWEALRQAQLKEFVEALPYGLNTIVGERGVKFSGGQRQRIAIARALYENPDILVLDEATSALDNDTETAVMESIDALQGCKTLIIVAHRLSTVRNCDKIYEVRDGKAVLRNKAEVLSVNNK